MPPIKPLPSSFISSATVNERTINFNAGIRQLTSPGLIQRHGEHSGETRWVWYSKKQVEEWCNEITDLGASGIRIYLGQKEENAEGQHTEEHEPLPGQICLMIVLTKENEDDPERHDNIVYESLDNFEERKALTDATNYMNLNAGSYSPPLRRPRITNDYPNDLLT